MELQPIAEESAKAAATSQSAAAAEAESLRRKVVIACGKRSESEDSDTAMLLAFATKRVLRREDSEATSPAPSSAGDLISVVHVSELPPLVLASGGRKHATSYTHASDWPAWMPTQLKDWPEQDNLMAYELHAAGSVAESIVDFVATELKPDLLLVVVEYADVPTLVVRGVSAPLQLAGTERRIAVCLDGSAGCRKIVEWAAKTLLSPDSDDVYLLHSPAGLEASQLLPAMGNIEACRSFLLAQGFPEHHVSPVELDFHVDARDSIVDFLEADNKPFDICISGSRGLKGTLTRFMLGSLTRYLLLYAPCSLLVLPPAALGEVGEE